VGLNVANPKVTEKGSGEERSDTELGLNLLAGTKYKTGRVSPYFDFGFTFWGSEQFKFTFGLDVALARDF
jgi:hypothetical protein